MAANRWLIILGFILLTGMLVTAAFALGVVVGQQGWISESITMGMNLPPAQAQQVNPPNNNTNQPNPNQLNPNANPNIIQPQRQPDFTGMVQDVADNLLILRTQDGIKQVVITEDTQFITPQGEELDLSGISQGIPLAVFGQLNSVTREFEAIQLIRLPER